jgi:uncharacterized protein (DUF1800 family)
MPTFDAATAAHRFGLGEPDLAVTGADPAGWLLGQLGPADPEPGPDLATAADGLRAQALFAMRLRRPDAAEPAAPGMAAAPSNEQMFVEHYRSITQSDLRAQLAAALATRRPFAERLALFWSNHFTVSMLKPAVRGMTGAFHREAVRPHIDGSFLQLLTAATTHGAMLRYLDNDRSAGPRSPLARARARRAASADGVRPLPTGLNENLAREVLELHTLGAASRAYTQQDVTAFAAVLTGWRVLPRPAEMATLDSGARVAGFDPSWHEPGEKTLLGGSVPEGPEGLGVALQRIARHPATADFIALKLARHFVDDDPPASLVRRLADRFKASDGHLPAVHAELVTSAEAWAPGLRKLKTPAEFAVSSLRLLQVSPQALARQPDAGIGVMGQRLQAAPSPAGWPDRQEDWLGPDAMWKRVEWATRLAERMGRQVDARDVARRALGSRLTPSTAAQVQRAADGAQALALLLLSPEFQRR